MFNRTAIMKAAHAEARALRCQGFLNWSYRKCLARALSNAWRVAKAKATDQTKPAAVRIAAINDRILAEECRPRMNFALAKSLRAELAELQAA